MSALSTASDIDLSKIAKGDTFADPDTGIKYIKQSDRATRRGCKFCGQGESTADREGDRGVWWAEPADQATGEHKWTLINKDGRAHSATCPKLPAKMAAKQAEPTVANTYSNEVPEVILTHEMAIADAEVRKLTRHGLKIHAIKRYRDLTRSSLVDAKSAIDKLAWDLSMASVPPAPKPAEAPLPELDDTDAAKVKMLLDLLAKPTVSREQVKVMVDYAVDESNKALIDHIAKIVSDAKDELRESLTAPLVVKFEQPNGAEPVTVENAHADLVDIVSALRAGRNIFMVGMAGTGKTTLAAHAAEALGLTFYDISMSPDAGRHLLMGYQTADGTFIPPSLYQAYKNGGLFHFDECDNSNPGLITVVNQILSNGHVRFADGELVTKHKDFRAMASGNTYGNGATAMYVGRQPLDGAFKNRWIMVTVKVDEQVEQAMCQATGATQNTVTKVLRYVRALRQSATDQQLEMLFTPRNSENLCWLLSIGWAVDKAVDSAIRMGASDTDWRKVHRTDQGSSKIQPFSL